MSLKRKIQTLKTWIRRSPAGHSRLDKEFQTYRTELKEQKKSNIEIYNY